MNMIYAILGVTLAPFAGVLITGADRILTAKFQSRTGPPILQPMYDIAKLWAKQPMIAHRFQPLCVYVYLAAAMVSVALFFAQSDLLLIFFIQAVGAIFLVIGAFLVPSPFSQAGANRELIQILTYEPLIIIVLAGIYLHTGSFKISAIYAMDKPLLMNLPLLFIVFGYALTIKLRKSPFDISASHHAHQELVRGVLTEYSGKMLALIEIAHLYETILILGLCSLFWSSGILGMTVLLVLTYLAEIVVDNISARMSFRWMLKSVWSTGLVLSAVNLVWLYSRGAA
ncbi:MAG: NADH-quinone oxidoreductase subunit H [Desulfobacteraceae bacterium]|nr:MAG: NADH-quinone oxidoreductase subunit H [Desulfobacteraceae bacterium]